MPLKLPRMVRLLPDSYLNGTLWKKALVLIICICVILTIVNLTQPKGNGFLYKPSQKHYLLRLKPQPYTVPPLNQEDYHRLVDLDDFTFTIANFSSCINRDIFLVVLVTSAPKNIERRNTIRTTWGRNDLKVKTFFMLGSVSDPRTQEALEAEDKLYGDIVQGNFLDSYNNLTYKSVMALKFLTYHCSNPTYILKSDDDVFVNMPLLKNFLINDMSPFGAENYLQCHVMQGMSVIRSRLSKWYVTTEQYAEKIYPTYCNGPYVIFSPDVIFKLYRAAQKTKYLHIEDVFLYGLAASEYPEITHTDLKEYSLWDRPLSRLYDGAYDDVNFLFGVLGMGVSDMERYWEYVISRPVPSSLYYFPKRN